MSEFVKLETDGGTIFYVKRWNINRIMQHVEGGAIVYLDQGEKDDLAVGTQMDATAILDLMDNQEKEEDNKYVETRSKRDEKIKEAVLEAIKSGAPVKQDEDVLEELFDDVASAPSVKEEDEVPPKEETKEEAGE